MEYLFLTSITVATVLYVVSDTSAPEEYYRLYCQVFKKESKVLNPNDKEWYASIPFLDRAVFLNKDNFWLRLISCPICLGTWVAVLFNLILFDFNLLHWGATIFFGWVFYILLKILVKCNNKIHE